MVGYPIMLTMNCSTASLSQEKNDWSFHAGYTHLILSKEDEFDDEWSLGIAYDDLPGSLGTS